MCGSSERGLDDACARSRFHPRLWVNLTRFLTKPHRSRRRWLFTGPSPSCTRRTLGSTCLRPPASHPNLLTFSSSPGILATRGQHGPLSRRPYNSPAVRASFSSARALPSLALPCPFLTVPPGAHTCNSMLARGAEAFPPPTAWPPPSPLERPRPRPPPRSEPYIPPSWLGYTRKSYELRQLSSGGTAATVRSSLLSSPTPCPALHPLPASPGILADRASFDSSPPATPFPLLDLVYPSPPPRVQPHTSCQLSRESSYIVGALPAQHWQHLCPLWPPT